MDETTTPPWERWARMLRALEDALPEVEQMYRDDPALPLYREYLDRKRREFRARIRRLVERN
jgi:hypothetical protein